MTSDGPDKPQAKPVQSDLATRVVSAVVLLALVFAVLFAGGWVFTQFLCVLSILAMHEWLTMTAKPQIPALTRFMISLLPAVFLSAFWDRGAETDNMLIFIAFALMVVAFVIRFTKAENWARNTLWCFGGLLYVTAPVLALYELRGAGVAGLQTVLIVFIIVWAADTAAYFAGRKIGGPKLAPSISPGKTWSGALGGLAGALIFGFGYLNLVSADISSIGLWAAVILAIAISSQFGDLFESAVKRHVGVKDSGNLIPGHGGVLDRIDGLVFAAVFAALIQWSKMACSIEDSGTIAFGLLCPIS